MAKLIGTSDTSLGMWTKGRIGKESTPGPDFNLVKDRIYDSNDAIVKAALKSYPWAFAKATDEK